MEEENESALRIASRTDATLFDVVVDIHTRGMV